ncbi:hypothetical protein [Bacillus niameyensis]|uniref:hypothetical protein n=1 Tax=Bacillus niameyensis TaxID=1522308 RepID=UPI000AD2A1A4|nr:hypothetical protein [Bacillus niameyensis]
MNRKKIGFIAFVVAIGLFAIQMVFLFLHSQFQVEYSDDRFYYVINIFFSICIALAFILMFSLHKNMKLVGGIIILLFAIANCAFLVTDHQKMKNMLYLSPDGKHVLSIKMDQNSGEATYYRTYYYLLARPKEKFPYQTTGNFKVNWLAKDIAAVTYKATDDTIHQYIATYGDRGGGRSYYYVGPSLYGNWSGGGKEVISNTEGITVISNGESELFDWDHIVQFGTLAIVLVRDDEAIWTIALKENFKVDSEVAIPQTGEISLLKATMGKTVPVTMQYVVKK